MYDVILVDGNSVGHACNAATRLTAGDLETQAIFGTIGAIRDLTIEHKGATVIVLWDGRAQWRYDLHPEYKGKRKLDPNKVPKPYEIEAQKRRESYHEQKPYIVEALGILGVRQILPQDDEADDIAGYLAVDFSNKGKKILLVSRDHDWLQLVDDNVSWFNPVEKETVIGATFEEYTGYELQRQFVEEKCLIGDSSDNVNGIAGIGAKAAPLIINHYGSVAKMLVAVEPDADNEKWKPPTKELNRYNKAMRSFAKKDSEGRKIWERNWKLMSLLEVEKPSNISVVKTPLNEEAFDEFCHQMAFFSILKKKAEWLQPFIK